MLLFVNLTFCLNTLKQICFSDKFMLNFNKSAKSSNSFCCNSCLFVIHISNLRFSAASKQKLTFILFLYKYSMKSC